MMRGRVLLTAHFYFTLFLSHYPIKQNGQGALSLGKANNALKGKYVVKHQNGQQAKGELDLSQFINFRKNLSSIFFIICVVNRRHYLPKSHPKNCLLEC